MQRLIFGFAISVVALQTNLTSPFHDLPRLDLDGTDNDGIKWTQSLLRAKASMSGGHRTCFLVDFIVQNKTFLARVDTGSSDSIFPHQSVNDYTGATINFDIPPGQEDLYSSKYGDGSWWKGYITWIDTRLVNTSISGVAPIALMTSQSSFPIFSEGDMGAHGLVGVAYPVLSSVDDTLLDGWYKNGHIEKNQVAIHGCPYRLSTESWIDIGNETPYYPCGGQSVTIGMPEKSYFTLDIRDIAIGGQKQRLSAQWQRNMWSILDSCTSNIMLPLTMVNSLRTQLSTSGGLSQNLTRSNYFNDWVNGRVALRLSPSDITWELLPNISITISSQSTSFSNLTLTMGPRQYIQKQDEFDDYYVVMISGSGANYATLGLPFFAAYHIILDRTLGTITFQPGCGCENSVDGYPLIQVDQKSCQCLNGVNSSTSGCDCIPPPAIPMLQKSASSKPSFSTPISLGIIMMYLAIM